MASARLNCSVMTEAPAELVEDIWFRPGICPNCFSSGAVIAEVIDLGARAGVEGLHLDGRVGNLRQRRQRQLQVGDRADDQDRDHQQRRGDRPQDEDARGIHCDRRWRPRVVRGARLSPRWRRAPARCRRRCRAGAARPARWRPRRAGVACGSMTCAPSRSRSPPSVTTISPAASPAVTATRSPSTTPSVTGRTRHGVVGLHRGRRRSLTTPLGAPRRTAAVGDDDLIAAAVPAAAGC